MASQPPVLQESARWPGEAASNAAKKRHDASYLMSLLTVLGSRSPQKSSVIAAKSWVSTALSGMAIANANQSWITSTNLRLEERSVATLVSSQERQRQFHQAAHLRPVRRAAQEKTRFRRCRLRTQLLNADIQLRWPRRASNLVRLTSAMHKDCSSTGRKDGRR